VSLHAPITIVSLVDEDRHVVKSSVGLTGRSRVWRKVPLALSFARRAVTSGKAVIISDVGDAGDAGDAGRMRATPSPLLSLPTAW